VADILLDMDGVLCDFMGRVFDVYAERHGRRYTTEEIKAHDLAQSVGRHVYSVMSGIFNEPGFFLSIKPYPGALDVVNEVIDAGHHVEVCSSPTVITDKKGHRKINGLVAHEKVEWISAHLPRLAGQVTITKNKWLVKGDFLIDDADYNIEAWCRAHPAGMGLVVSQPWNRSMVLPTNARRIDLTHLPRALGIR
jgi:5'(3')-deoxyribonucleotidase